MRLRRTLEKIIKILVIIRILLVILIELQYEGIKWTRTRPKPNVVLYKFLKSELGFQCVLLSIRSPPQSLQRLRSRKHGTLSLSSLSLPPSQLGFLLYVVLCWHCRVLFLQTKRTKKAGIVGKYGMSCYLDFSQIRYCFFFVLRFLSQVWAE